MFRHPQPLTPALTERVLSGLGFDARPEPNLEGLTAIYAAWCQRVPFDNVRKLMHLRGLQAGPLPGETAEDFFEAWLDYGTGGTCWAGNGALQALLRSLDFDAQRGLATMLVAPNIPPNHGTVMVRCGRGRYLVDASMLYGAPLILDERAPTAITHGAWGVQCARRERHWIIRWRPLHATGGVDCRIERLVTSALSFHERHERSRGWSPFNYALYARLNRGSTVLGTAFGQRVELDAEGSVWAGPLPAAERAQLLIEQLGMRESLISQLPLDLPTPPPPQSASARAREP